MNPDPFQYTAHKARYPGYAKAVALSTPHRGVLFYKQSAVVLSKHGLRLNKQTFYNLERRQGQGGKLSKTEELALLLEYLTLEDFRVRIDDDYSLDEEEEVRTGRVV